MRGFLAAALVIGLVGQTREAFAYTCNDNHYVNSSGHWVHSPSCGTEPDHQEAVCRDGSVSFLNTAAGRARITAAWNTGSESRADDIPASIPRPSDRAGRTRLAETTVRAANVEGAIRHAGDAEWPPGAYALRLVDWTAKRSTNGSRPVAAELVASAIGQAEP